MRRHVTAARQETAPVLEEASALFAQKHELETKHDLIDAFNRHFIVSDEDLQVLTTVSDDVDDRFFTTLKKVKQIHLDCRVLLGSENQRLGIELMDQTSRNLNVGYQKLFKWIQNQFKTLNLENPQISAIIRRALRALAERPILFQSCLDFFAEAREHVLTDTFYAALTGSSSANHQNPMTRPIEFHAHDPLRYVGDMLAWTHSSTVSEREALENLFIAEGDEINKGFQAGREAEPWSVDEVDEAFDGRKALGDLINRNVNGVARALRQRVEQVIQNHDDPVSLYKISNLINFYRLTFDKLLGSDSSVLESLSSLQESSLRQFRNAMSDHVSGILADIVSPPADLRIPEFLNQALLQFSALIKSYDSSMTPASSRTAEFETIFTQALDPYLAASDKLAKEIKDPGKSIFLTNCLLAAKHVLAKYDFVQGRVSSLKGQIESIVPILSEYQHAFFLHTSGLHPLLVALEPLDDSRDSLLKVPTLPPFASQSLTDASQMLDDFLPSALMDAMENLRGLNSTKLAQEITAEGVEKFCEDFEFVEGKLTAVDELHEGLEYEEGDDSSDEEGKGGSENEGEVEGQIDGEGGEKGKGNTEPKDEGEEGVGEKKAYVPLRSVFPRTSGEIRVLLS